MLASSVRAPHNEAIAAASAHAIRSGVQMTSHTELETPDRGPGAGQVLPVLPLRDVGVRSEEPTPELQSLMSSPYGVFCLKTTKHSYTTSYTSSAVSPSLCHIHLASTLTLLHS